jgi:hypothetical protein
MRGVEEIGGRAPPEVRGERFGFAFNFLERKIIPHVRGGEELGLDQLEELAEEFRRENFGPGFDFKLIDAWVVACYLRPLDEQEAQIGKITPEELEVRGKTIELLKQALVEHYQREVANQPSFPRQSWVPSHR